MSSDRPVYRPDIDGLRAVAVLVVLLNHFSRDLIPNGYLGVDVFFVISGYVITGSLAKHDASSFRSYILDFYSRRVRRILPALLLCSAVSAVLICLVNPYPQMTLETGLAGVLGFSNLYLFFQSVNYFAPSVDLNVFMHTWSLGVEEQFYLVYPLLYWAVYRIHSRRPNLTSYSWVIGLCSAVSLGLFLFLKQSNPAAAFFLMPTRFWELAAGCLVFVHLQGGRAFLSHKLSHFFGFVALIGLILILLFSPLPSAGATVLVVLLTSWLIAPATGSSSAHRLLGSPGLVAIGLGSYSLYLWHWPVLSISRWTIGLHWWLIPGQLVLIALLTWLSWRWVEQPFRGPHGPLPPQWILPSGFLAIALTLLGMVGLHRSWSSWFYLGRRSADSTIALLPGARALPVPPVSSCNLFEQHALALRLDPSCGIPLDPARRTLYVVGDSHGWQFLKSLRLYADDHRLNLISVWGNACPFPAAFARGLRPEHDLCYTRQRALEQQLLLRLRPGDLVFIANQLNAHFGGHWEMHWRRYRDDTNVYAPDGRRLTLEDAALAYKSRFLAFSQSLSAKDARVIFYLDPPQFPYFDGGETCADQPFAPLWLRWECHTDRSSHQRRLHHFFAWIVPWRQADPTRRSVFNTSEYVLCPQGRCNALHYTDSNHMKDYYADYVWKRFLDSVHGRRLKTLNAT